MKISMIGENAGIIWRTLESKGNLSLEQLQSETELQTPSFYAAIGWLARENKISFANENDVITVRLYQERYN